MQVLGCLMQQPTLLDETSRQLTKEDFPEPFHKIIFGVIQNLAIDGVTDIDYIAVDNFLSKYEKQYEIFNMNNGMEYLVDAKERANLSAFDYNVDRTMKFSLLRALNEKGIDTSEIYNDRILSPKKSEEMQERFDEMGTNDIVNEIDKKLMDVKNDFTCGDGCFGGKAGEGLDTLKERLKESPEIGSPLCSKLLNTIFRGARLKKLYLRSAATGVGKHTCHLV